MAAVLSEEQVLEIILNDDEDQETDESCEPDNDQIIRGKLVDLVASFDAGPEFKHGFFRDTAVELLLPVAQLSQKVFHDTADLQA